MVAGDGVLVRVLSRPTSSVAVVPRILIDAPPCTDELTELSERMRTAGATALVLRGPSLEHVRLVLEEQRSASGNYPGPLPVIFEATHHDPADLDSLKDMGASGVVLQSNDLLSTSPPPLVAIPRCDAAADVRATLTSASPPPLLFATPALVDELGNTNGDVGALCAGQSPPIVMASLPLGDDMAARARELRALGCRAAVVDFDADEWPGPPEALVGAVLSKRSPMIGSLGVQNNAAGTFTSEQYWMNRKFKEARERGRQRELKYGSRHTDAASGATAPGLDGSGAGAAGSQIKKVDS